MSRPKTKEELLMQSQSNFAALLSFIDQLPEEKRLKEFPAGTMNRNICDVLAHLHVWNLMTLGWYSVGMGGDKPDMPAKGYSWKTLPALNRKIWEEHRGDELTEFIPRLKASFQDVQEIIKDHTDEELFTKKLYGWTGSTSLGSYLISVSSSHYDWALKLIRKAKR